MADAPTEVLWVEFEPRELEVHYRAFDLSSAGSVLVGFSVNVYGWALKNPSGSAAAAIDIYDGADSSGVPVFPVYLAANADSTIWFGPNGIRFKNGVYANVTAGEVKGSLFFRHVR